mgnify:CR=1 FL=1
MFDTDEATIYPLVRGESGDLDLDVPMHTCRVVQHSAEADHVALVVHTGCIILKADAARTLLAQLMDALGVKAELVVTDPIPVPWPTPTAPDVRRFPSPFPRVTGNASDYGYPEGVVLLGGYECGAGDE